MKGYQKIVDAILIIGGFLFLVFSNFNTEIKIIIFITGLLLYLFHRIDKRFRKIENALGLLLTPTMEEEISKPLSYKISIHMNIEWFEIVKHCFPDLKTTEGVGNFVHNLFKEPNLIDNGEKEKGLFQKYFSFIAFYYGLSRLTQYWSDYHKTFVDELEVRGYVFGGFGSLDNLYLKFGSQNKMWRRFVVRPEFIGFQSDLPDGCVMEEDKISQIPLYDIIDFLEKVYKNIGSQPMHAIKIFPKELQNTFDKNNVKYEVERESWQSVDFSDSKIIESKWAKNNNIEIWHNIVRYHVFKTPYYSLSIKMEFFD